MRRPLVAEAVARRAPVTGQAVDGRPAGESRQGARARERVKSSLLWAGSAQRNTTQQPRKRSAGERGWGRACVGVGAGGRHGVQERDSGQDRSGKLALQTRCRGE
jgi:hypothetical protein